jgi:hypothetical protein
MVPSINEIEQADLDQCCAWIAHGALPSTEHSSMIFKMIVQRAINIISAELKNIEASNELPTPDNNLAQVQVNNLFEAMLVFKKRVAMLAELDGYLIRVKDYVLESVSNTEDYLAKNMAANVVMFRGKKK